MRGNRFRLLMMVGWTAVIVPIMGCAIAADLVNPSFLSALGLDPEAVLPSSGTVVVAFVNESQVDARFRAYWLAEPGLLSSARNLVVDVGQGESRFMALDCPVGAFSPGSVIGGTVDTLALILASAVEGEAAEGIPWEGSTLIGGVDFKCGDVIEFAATADRQFLLRVLPS